MKWQQLVIATSNSGKISEISSILNPIKCLSLKDFSIKPPLETGHTFIENAIIKARHTAQLTNLPTLADDSGLVIPELNFIPGIFSARFAGENASDQENINLVLDIIKKNRLKNPAAYFYCAIVFMPSATCPDPIVTIGKLEGYIVSAPVGSEGFGYDPIFYLEKYKCTLAELNQTIKNSISHRYIALKKLKLKF